MVRARYGWIAALLALAAAGCEDGGKTIVEPNPDPGPWAEMHVARFTYTGPIAGKFEAIGPGKIPTDFSTDFATLSSGSFNSLSVPFTALAVNAGSVHTLGGFDILTFYVNPAITAPGRYTAANCPPTDGLAGCINGDVRFGVPRGGGAPQFSLMPVADSVSVTVQTIVADTLRVGFEGTFRLLRDGEPNEHVQVTHGILILVRNGR